MPFQRFKRMIRINEQNLLPVEHTSHACWTASMGSEIHTLHDCWKKWHQNAVVFHNRNRIFSFWSAFFFCHLTSVACKVSRTGKNESKPLLQNKFERATALATWCTECDHCVVVVLSLCVDNFDRWGVGWGHHDPENREQVETKQACPKMFGVRPAWSENLGQVRNLRISCWSCFTCPSVWGPGVGVSKYNPNETRYQAVRHTRLCRAHC